MTFGAMPAWTATLLLGGVAALAAWLFLRKLRPPRVLVSSLLLWRRVLGEARELTLWERIRRAVSLVATVAIALALALAVTRPARRSGSPSVARGRVLIVIDSSWSMATRTSSGESRWDRALAQARRLAAAGAGDEIAVATTADGLVEGPTSDSVLIETALDHLAAGAGDATAWPQLAGADVVHFITDGAVARRLPPGVEVHSVYERADNVAVTAFDVRPSLAARTAGDAYLEIGNFAAAAQTVHLTLTRGATVILDRQLTLAADETLRQIVPLSYGSDARLRAHVDAPRNALGVDDDGFAWIEHAMPLSVTVVGEATGWLRPLLGGDPDVAPRFVGPASYVAARPGAPADAPGDDLVIFDRWAPTDPPSRPALLFAPPADTPWLAQPAGETSANASVAPERKPHWETPGTHAVVRGVDPLTLIIERARAYGSPALRQVAQSAEGTPLVYVSEGSTQRMVLVTFGPGESNLASAPGFPVLMGNAMDWLVRPETRRTQSPGPATFGNAVRQLTGPTGATVPLARVNDNAMARLREPGFYVAEGSASTSTFAVNAGDPQLSNTGHSTLTASALAHQVSAGASGRPWWIYCVGAAFALSLAEWWTWQRRITV